MYDEFEELEKMIEQLKADDTGLESLDEFTHLMNYVIKNVDSLLKTNEKLIDIVKLQQERINELERTVYGAQYEG